MVASQKHWAVLPALVSLPQEVASSKVQPERPPHCGESDVIWMAYLWGW